MKIRFIIIALLLMSLNAHAQKYHYDVNNDGQVTVSDIMLIVNKILGKADDEPTPRMMTFNVGEEPIKDSEANASTMRRTPATNYDLLKQSGFYVNYTYKDYSFEDAPEWTYSKPEIPTKWVETDKKWMVGDSYDSGTGAWPTYSRNDEDVNFYAFANVDAFTPSGNNKYFFCNGYKDSNKDVSDPYIHFTLEENSTETKDLLVAKKSDSWNNCKGQIFFQFKHACAALQFFVRKTEKLSSFNVVVKSVKLYNVQNEGNYHFADEAWKNVGFLKDNSGNTIPTTYTLFNAAGNEGVTVPNFTEDRWQLSSTQAAQADLTNDYFFFIPQTFTAWDKTPIGNSTTGSYIELDCVISPQADSTNSYTGKAYIPFNTESQILQAGYSYPVNVNIGAGLVNKNGVKIFDSNGTTIVAGPDATTPSN